MGTEIIEDANLSDDVSLRKRRDFHRALANLERLKIVDKLKKGEICQCDIFPELGLSQSTVSAYLNQLVRAGILKVRKDGTRKLYSVATNEMKAILSQIEKSIE
jgi:ArsR family transcriptional regulator